jgi:hypothetical protein
MLHRRPVARLNRRENRGDMAGYAIERNRRTHSRYFAGDQLVAGDKRATG